MKSDHPLEDAFFELAASRPGELNAERMRAEVWREIHHRQALHANAAPISFWYMLLLVLDSRKSAVAAGVVALAVGVGLGIFWTFTPQTARVAAKNLDLTIFSSFSSGWPSNTIASSK